MDRQKTFHLILLILLSLLLSGCWNRRELGNLSIVQGIGIDKTADDQISLTVQILKPGSMKGKSSEGSSEKAIATLTSTGKDLQDAFRNATRESDRKLYSGQMKIIVIGEEAAKMGIAPLLDLLNRDQENRRTEFLFIAHGKAKDILEAEHIQEKLPSKGIENLAKATASTSQIPKVIMNDTLKTISSKTSAPFIPGIKVVEQKKSEQGKKTIKLEDTAVFNGDKLIGWLDKKETRGLLWILGQVKSGVLLVKSPGDEKKYAGLEIIRASSKVKAKVIDNRLVIHVKVTETGNLSEQLSEVQLTTPERFKQLEEKQTAMINDEITAAIVKAQQDLGVDIFKFGEAVHREFPQEWKELKTRWDEEFPNIDINVEVDASIRNVGMIMKSEKAAE